MRVLFLAVSFALIGAAATVACSSASPATNATDAGATGATSSSSSSGNVVATTSSSSSSGDTTTDTDAGDGGTEASATTSGGVLTQNSDAGADCDPDAYGEQEPNDTAPGNALPVTATGTFKFCGTIVNGNDDFVTFTIPQFNNIQFLFTGGLNISGTIGNNTFQCQGGGCQLPQTQPGDVWTTKIHTGSTTPRAYQITFDIQ